MISCHSSAGRASQGGHARLTGRSAGSHCWGGELGFQGAAAQAGPAAMNRFNGLCKVCSERRYRQVGAWPLGGVWDVVGDHGWGLTKQDSSPHKAFFASACPLQVHCDLGAG